MITPFHKLPRPRRRFALGLAAEDGLTLIEVLVTSLMVGLIGLTLVGLDAAGRTTADQRARSQAVQVAQQDQERIKGLSADQIADLDQTRTVTVDGVPFEVRSQGRFISSSAAVDSCSASGAAADYAKVVTTVNWDANKASATVNRRPPIVEQSLITPRAGGSILADVNDETGAALPGATITVAGTDQNTSPVRRRGISDSTGCTIFGALLVGDYSVTSSLSGYVDPQGDAAPTNSLTSTAGNTSTSLFSLGRAGAIDVNNTFATYVVAGTLVNGQKAPSMSWNNSGMLTAGKLVPSAPATRITTATNLYPFTVSTSSYTKNYSVWAGSCATDFPSSVPASQSFATVAPGTVAGSTVLMPAMAILAQLKTSSSTTRVVPDHVKLTDSCGQSWNLSGSDLSSSGATSSAGVLAKPGQPYTPSYTVCIDDKNGTTSYKTTTTMSNTNFSAATSKTITVDSTLSANQGTC